MFNIISSRDRRKYAKWSNGEGAFGFEHSDGGGEFFRGGNERENVDVEGERLNANDDEELLQNNENYHDVNDVCSNSGSDNDELYEDARLDFDQAYPPMDKWTKDHPKEKIIGNPQEGVLTRDQIRAKNEVLNTHQEFFMFNVFISKIEPKTVKIAMEHSDWVVGMQSELSEIERNKVWRLIPKPNDVLIVGLKWIFKNKTNKDGNIIQNKARLVVKGYS